MGRPKKYANKKYPIEQWEWDRFGKGAWNSVDPESAMEVNSTATSYSGGIITASTVVLATSGNKATPGTVSKTLVGRLPFGIGIDGTEQTTLALIAYGTGINITASFTFQWEEVR